MRKLLYGQVSLHSEECPRCGHESFVVGGKFVCCDQPLAEIEAKSWKRMSITRGRRHVPPWKREEIIGSQNGRCFYCQELFTDKLYRRGKLWNKRINVDHWEPFSFSCDDGMPNLVAACSVCNGIKSDLIFKDRYECREYISQQRRSKGYTSERPIIGVSSLRDAVRE